jgi:2-polyprenyl-3-methyl-5-hydroxy-6-metoxy-1,4-benzoquinol methylase
VIGAAAPLSLSLANISDMRFHTTCLVCNSDRLGRKDRYSHAYLVKCARCGFIFCDRLPTEMELQDHYRGYNYDKQSQVSPITVKRYHELLDEFEKYRKNNLLLDVGCGAGFFLQEAMKRGWNAHGTEFSDAAIEVCSQKGIPVVQGVLDHSKFDNAGFDVIFSSEVIEHINNPSEELPNIYRLLREGGLYYVTTPNFNGLLRYYLKEKYNIIVYPEHLSYYTPRTLHFLFSRNGLKKKHLFTSGISMARLRASLAKCVERVDSAGATDEDLRIKIEQSWYMKWVKGILNFLFRLTGTGATIKAYYVKPTRKSGGSKRKD